MVEEKKIPTSTIATADGNRIDILTIYDQLLDCDGNASDLPDVLKANIGGNGIENGVFYEEGDLFVTFKNNDVMMWIDSFGNLWIHCENDDAEHYFVNEEGDLIYDFMC